VAILEDYQGFLFLLGWFASCSLHSCVPNRDLPPFFSNADLAAAPSLREYFMGFLYFRFFDRTTHLGLTHKPQSRPSNMRAAR
jgi:hypothetical protein